MTRKISLFALMAALLFAASCSKESKVINLGDTIVSSNDTSTGYSLPIVTAIYPANFSADVSTTTTAIIVFNMPIDSSTVNANITVESPTGTTLVRDTHYSLSTGTNYVIITFIGTMSPIPYSRTVTINVLSGLRDRDNLNYIDLTNSISLPVTFTTGSAADVTAPIVLAADIYPLNNAVNVPIATTIYATFSEPLDPATVNGNTFYLERDADSTRVEAALSYNTGTYRATLTPSVSLLNDESYTVHITTGIKDMSGNAYAGDNVGTEWYFDTVAATDATAPTLTGNSPSIGSITDPSVSSDDATATINWTTNEPTNYTINYGTSSAFGTNVSNTIVYDLVHSVTLTGLTEGTRYYYRIVFADEFGNSTTSATYIFNTQSSETLTTIASGAGNQMMAKYIPQKAGVANTGAFVFWYNGTYHINGALYNSSFTQQWATGIFPDSYYFISAVEDEVGGVIVLASNGGTGVYAKRLDSSGSFDWGYAEGVAGLTVDAAGTKGAAAPVYNGIFNQLGTQGTVEMTNISNANIFFDFDVNFTSSGVADGDLVFDTGNSPYTISTVDYAYSDFYRHSLYQNTDTVNATESYRIVDVSINSSGTSDYPLTLADNASTVYVSTHSYIAPGWLSAAAAPNGDIMEVNGEYVYITALNASYTGLIDSGTNGDSYTTGHLVNSGASWGTISQPVEIGDTVENTDTLATATVTAVSGTDLTLNSEIFTTAAGQNYEITGTADSGITGGSAQTDYHLSVIAAGWGDGSTGPVYVNDVVVNTTTPASTTVATGGVTDADLTLDADIFNSTGEGYHIYHTLTGATTSWAPANVNYLYDSTASWGTGSGPVYVGDIVYNTTDSTNATVTAVTNTQLTLSAAIFNPAGGDAYEIYDTFYAFSVSSPVDIATDPTFVIYNNVALASGTADTAAANPLYDNDPATIFTTLGVADGDLVFNYTDGTIGEVDNSTFNIRDRALDINSSTANMFADGEAYRIYEFLNGDSYADIVTSGIATGGSSTTIVDTGNTFTSVVDVGDVVYNVNDALYARVTVVAANTLTLSGDATFAANDRYIVVRETVGVLYAWQEGTGVNWKILSADTPATVLYAEQTIANARNPQVISNGLGRAFIIYEDTSTSSNIYARLKNGIGTNIVTTDIDGSTNNETILKVISDGSGGLVVLYARNATSGLYVQRLDSSGAVQWSANGRSVGNPTAIDSTTPVSDAVDIVCDLTGNNSVIVTAQIGNNIWANRVINLTTGVSMYPWAAAGLYISNPTGTSIQQKPKVYTDWGTYARIVWEDNRFVTGGGYGIFGQLVTLGAGTFNWYADTLSTDDDGISVVLNPDNGYWPNVIIVPYANNASANILWDDYRNGTAADLGYRSLSGFAP